MKYIGLWILLIMILSCETERSNNSDKDKNQVYQDIIEEGYELSIPAEEVKAVLVLFGGYPESPKDVKEQFNILPIAKKNQVAVLIMNYNQKLYLEEGEKKQLAERLLGILKEHKLPLYNLYIGGFSSGGNVSLLLSSYIMGHPELDFNPKGVFIVDSPIELSALYFSAEKNLENNFSKPSVAESTWIIEQFTTQFGNPHLDLSKYEHHSVFTLKTDNTHNISELKNTKIRLYTEPDTLWWQQNRMAAYEQTNAFYIKNLAESLKAKQFKDVVYIATENKGYRANGERHPHSWSIVDEKNLMQWILSD